MLKKYLVQEYDLDEFIFQLQEVRRDNGNEPLVIRSTEDKQLEIVKKDAGREVS